MISLNNVVISGNLTADPETRQAGTSSVLDFRVALNRSYKDSNGEWQEQTDFIDVSAFGLLGERAESKLSKGSRVLVQGKLRQRSWQADDGSTRSKVGVVADDLLFLDKNEQE